MTKYDESEVELAERYAAALKTIERLSDTGNNWSEEDCDMAERYVAALEDIELKSVDIEWSEEDVDLAERYVEALKAIDEHQPVDGPQSEV